MALPEGRLELLLIPICLVKEMIQNSRDTFVMEQYFVISINSGVEKHQPRLTTARFQSYFYYFASA
jgi:hypothetical protein